MIEDRYGLWYLTSSEEPVQVPETGSRILSIVRLQLVEGRPISLIVLPSIP